MKAPPANQNREGSRMDDKLMCENCHLNEIEGPPCDSIWVCGDCREKIQRRHKTAINRNRYLGQLGGFNISKATDPEGEGYTGEADK